MNFGISFTNPWALLLWPPLVAYFVWLAGRSLADLSPLRRRVAVAMRVIVTTLVVCAIAGMQLVRFNRDLAVMFVVDYSDSVGPNAKAAALKYLQEATVKTGKRDKWGVVVFGRDAFIEMTVGQGTIGPIQTVPPTEFTDISAAVRLAMASLPDGMQKRVVVLSDGNENLGNAVDEAQMASNNEVAIDVVPLTAPQRQEVLLEKLTVPNEAKIGEPIEIKVVGNATHDADIEIRLSRNGKYLGSRKERMTKGKNVFVFPQNVEDAGIISFEAQIDAKGGADTVPENNRALGFVNVQGKPRVLLVSNEPADNEFINRALQGEKLNVETTSSAGLPSQLRDMQPYDAIILNNVPAWELTGKQMLGLQSYVRDLGCGLVMIGGENSYGPGGYRETPIEETLPVTMDIKNMQFIPGGSVAMIMHSCEFEGGNDWAKSVCTQVTRQLGDNDYAGLVVYGMDASWVYEMLKVGENRNLMLTKIRSINPGDMPDFDAALQLAYDGLVKTKSYLKHCIILSDGDPSPPRPDLVKKFNDARITVSTIVIQPHDNSGARSMQNIARQHGGRSYQVKSPRQIPNIFLKEAATISRSAIVDKVFTPQLGNGAASPIIKGIDRMPNLLGYVGTSSKPTASEVLISPDSDPILATWQYGLGKSVAFTSDARQRWAAGWLGWGGFSKFWAQGVRWSMRQSSNSDLQTVIDIDKGVGKVIIEAVDDKGNFLNFLSPKARLVTPDLKGSDLSLDQTGPGRYEASFDARQLGTYLVNIRTQRGDKVVSQVSGAVVPYSPEYKAVGTDQFLLSRMADSGGGDQLALEQANRVFSRPRITARSPRDIWLTLLMVAACLFPLDVAVRRLLWGEEELRNLRSRLRFPRRGTTKKTEKKRDPSMDRLLRTKKTETTATPKAEAPGKAQPTGDDTPSGITMPPGDPSRPTAPRPAAPPSAARPAPPVEEAAPEPDEPDELDPMERLRRAKRRARGGE